MTQPSRKKNKALSLYPLQFEQAVQAFMKIEPERKTNRKKKGKGRKQT